MVLFVCVSIGAELGALESGAEKWAESGDRGGEDTDIQFAGCPDGNVDAVPKEIVEFSVEREVVDFDDAGY